MESIFPPSVKSLLRKRQTCLFLSDYNSSFQWSFFSYYILPHLKYNSDAPIKGTFSRNTLNVIVPFSCPLNSSDVFCTQFSHKEMKEFKISFNCNLYFVNTYYLALDSLCFAVYVGEGAKEIYNQIRFSELFSIKSVAYVNDAFQPNGATFLGIIETTIYQQPKLNIGHCIINLLGAHVGADSIDTPQQALKDSSKTNIHQLGMNLIEVDYNKGILLGQIASLFTLNTAYINVRKKQIFEEAIILRDKKAELLHWQIDLSLLVSDGLNNIDILTELNKGIKELNISRIMKFVDPDFSEWVKNNCLDRVKQDLVKRIQSKCNQFLKLLEA